MPVLREALAPTLRWPDVPTLTVENGIGAEKIAAEIRPAAPKLAGSLTAPIRLASEDEVRVAGPRRARAGGGQSARRYRSLRRCWTTSRGPACAPPSCPTRRR